MVSPPGTADGLKTNTAHVIHATEHDDGQAGSHLDVPLVVGTVGAGNRR